MKAHSFIAIASILIAATGCVAQAGTEDPASSSEDLNDPAAVIQKGVATKQVVRTAPEKIGIENENDKQQIARQLGDGVERTELSNPGVDPGDPVQDPNDPGGGTEPDPHPWHTDNAAVIKR